MRIYTYMYICTYLYRLYICAAPDVSMCNIDICIVEI